jgi:hypothetical protein
MCAKSQRHVSNHVIVLIEAQVIGKMRGDDMSVRIIEQLAPQAFHAAAAELGLADDLLIDAETIFVEEAKADMARTLPKLANIYAEHYSADELRELAAFYETPLGRKMLLVEPKIYGEWEAFSRDWARTLMAKVLLRLETKPTETLEICA